MRIHTNTITLNDLYRLVPSGVYLDVSTHGSRKRARAFEVTLYVYEQDELHRRLRNFNRNDDLGDYAATWDEWGIWMQRLYDIDPNVVFPYYANYEEFVSRTRQHRNYVRMTHKPEHLAYRTHTAPWLEDDQLADKRARLEELRLVLRAENMSWGELAELQGLAEYIEEGDVELLEAAGVPEHDA